MNKENKQVLSNDILLREIINRVCSPYLEEGKQMQWEKEVRERVQKAIEDETDNTNI